MPSSVSLGKALESTVDDLVRTGRYGSRSEVLREGVRLVQEREAKLAILDAEIQKGLDDIDAGRTEPIEDVLARLQAKYAAQLAKPAA